ncbi:unnamed protein product [Rhodiola kirilowii]
MAAHNFTRLLPSVTILSFAWWKVGQEIHCFSITRLATPGTPAISMFEGNTCL